jgi:hypothetical protein
MAACLSRRVKTNILNEENTLIRGRINPSVAVLILLVASVISNPAWAQRDRDREPEERRDSGYSIASFRPPLQIDFGGGPGGQEFTDARCGRESVATGFHVQMGEYFNLIWVDCARLRRNGSLDRDLTSSPQAGKPGGNRVADAQCSGGLGLIGLRGRTGEAIDEAAGVCADPREVEDRDRREHFRPEFTTAIAKPSPGGQPIQAMCQPGQVMVGIRAKSGRWIDHLWILCSNIERH